MDFKYSCFISYRHGQKELLESFMKQFLSALEGELELLTNLDVYIDKNRISTGTILNKELAQSLCRSACMIFIYTPRYFGTDSTYCIREFLAMKELEKKRLAPIIDKSKSIIVPVILRGKKNFPDNIFTDNDTVIYCDFERFTLTEERILENPKFYPKIQEIAQHIFDRLKVFENMEECHNCNEFDFPDEEKAMSWVDKTIKKVQIKFPFRDN